MSTTKPRSVRCYVCKRDAYTRLEQCDVCFRYLCNNCRCGGAAACGKVKDCGMYARAKRSLAQQRLFRTIGCPEKADIAAKFWKDKQEEHSRPL